MPGPAEDCSCLVLLEVGLVSGFTDNEVSLPGVVEDGFGGAEVEDVGLTGVADDCSCFAEEVVGLAGVVEEGFGAALELPCGFTTVLELCWVAAEEVVGLTGPDDDGFGAALELPPGLAAPELELFGGEADDVVPPAEPGLNAKSTPAFLVPSVMVDLV